MRAGRTVVLLRRDRQRRPGVWEVQGKHLEWCFHEDCLELVHCHPGSQLHDIRRVKDAIGELAHVYADLVRMGATSLRYLDVGGGLGVDYDGSQTNFPSSMNYTVAEYANEGVYRVASVWAEKEVPAPTIVTRRLTGAGSI